MKVPDAGAGCCDVKLGGGCCLVVPPSPVFAENL